MAFFESYDAVYKRSGPAWEKGWADYKTAPRVQKPFVAAGGLVAAAGGLGWGLVKTGGVATHEYIDRSFGRSRGKTFFEYVSTSPVLHTLGMAVVAQGVGMALRTLGFDFQIPGLGTTFLGGAGLYTAAYLTRSIPNVVSAVATGVAGRGLSLVRGQLGRGTEAPSGDGGDWTLPPRLPGAPVG
jgi:hypothetical protein